MIRSHRFLLGVACMFICCMSVPPRPAAAALSGTYSVGPSGDYPNLTAATGALYSQGGTGRVLFELAPDYTSSGETFPIQLYAYPAIIRPQAGATGLVISSDSTATLFRMTFGTGFLLDGRPGGVGSSCELTLRATSPSAGLVHFDDAGADTLRYLNIEGAIGSSTSGLIYFSPAGVMGVSDIVIEHCRIRASTATPTNLIYSAAGNVSRQIRRITVQDCELSDYGSSTSSSAACVIQDYNFDWVFRRNSIFQTAPRNIPVASRVQYAVLVNAPMQNLVFEDNWIGGSAPQCGGAPWTLTGVGNMSLVVLSSDAASMASVRRNTIRNISATVVGASPTRLLSLSGPMVVADNVIGDSTIAGRVAITATTGVCTALNLSLSDSCRVFRNRISGLSLTATTGSLLGINVASPNTRSVIVRGNTVGGATAASAVTSTGSGQCSGIVLAGTSEIATQVDSNRVSFLSHAAGTSASLLCGIRLSGSACAVSDNDVHDLTSSAAYTAPVGTPGVVGIHGSYTQPRSVQVLRNHVRALSSTAAASAVTVAGIALSMPAASDFRVDANNVHSLSSTTSDTTAAVTGIQCVSLADPGAGTCSNNMVSVGVSASGGDAAAGAKCRGILSQGPTTWVGNSVHVGGVAGGAGAADSRAFEVSDAGAGATLRNNVIENARGAWAAGGRHTALRVGSLPLAGLSSDYNLLHAPGARGVLASAGATEYPTLIAWQGVGLDANSRAGDPLFAAPNGNALSVDLHIPTAAAGTSAAANGASVWLGWLTDIDGESRDAATPDIGADEFSNAETDVDGHPTQAGLALAPAWPNPTRGGCTLEFGLARGGIVRLEVFDPSGRLVRRLLNGSLEPGTHSLNWDGRDGNGRTLPAGAYMVRLEAAGTRGVRRVVLLR